jgi:pimeloyl-ACP methyl ester carboxylesterase
MLVDLVQVTATDELRLHGMLETPGERVADAPLDAWLCIHGTGSNFYSASTLAGLAPKLLATGAAVLRGNTRGHDIVSTGPSAGGRWLQGAAFERVDEAPRDLAAWIDFLRGRGYQRIGLLGHSMGAIKAVLTLAAADAPPLEVLVAVSPPRLSYERFCRSQRSEEFRQTFARCKELVGAGRGDELLFVKFPLAYYITAAGYLDRYGPEERYNVLRLVDRVTCPTLVTFGSLEVQTNEAFRGLPDELAALSTPENSLQVAVIAGADHNYTGCHDSLAGVISKWLARTRK